MTKDGAWVISVRRLNEILERWDSWSDETLARRLASMVKPKTFKLVHPKILRTRQWMQLTRKMTARWPGIGKNPVEHPIVLDAGKDWWEERNLKGESLERARECRVGRDANNKRWAENRKKSVRKKKRKKKAKV